MEVPQCGIYCLNRRPCRAHPPARASGPERNTHVLHGSACGVLTPALHPNPGTRPPFSRPTRPSTLPAEACVVVSPRRPQVHRWVPSALELASQKPVCLELFWFRAPWSQVFREFRFQWSPVSSDEGVLLCRVRPLSVPDPRRVQTGSVHQGIEGQSTSRSVRERRPAPRPVQ